MDRDFDRKDGKWFPVMNELADKLMCYELTKIEHRVLWMFFRFCYGYNNSTCELRWIDMVNYTGLPKGSLSKAINRLKGRNILKSFHTETKTHTTYKINSKISSWKLGVSKRKQFPYGNQKVSKRKLNSSQTETLPIKDNIKTTIKTKAKPEPTVLPVWLDIQVWKEFKKYRQNGKGKFTAYAQELAIKKLARFKADGDDPNEVINNSIENGWSGLFPLKRNHEKEETREQCIKRLSQKR